MGCPSKFTTQRLLILFLPALLLTVLILAFPAGSLSRTFQAGKDTASFERPHDGTSRPSSLTTDDFGDLISELYKHIKLPITAESFIDQRGNRFDNGGRNSWNTPIGKEILIVDIDTRIPLETSRKMDWETVQASGSGLLTVSHINHFLYCKLCYPDLILFYIA